MARLYDTALQSNRLATSTASGAVLALAGDFAAQAGQAATSSDGQTYDTRRGATFAIFGGVVTGPINYVWLNSLERWTARLAPGGGTRALLTKVCLQSGVLQPFIYLPTFFAVTALANRNTVEQACQRVRDDYGATLGRLWLFWTPSVIFAFKLLPVRQQAVFFSGMGLTWNVILSCLANPAGPRLTLSRP